jgi:hypothetical protein
MNATLDAVGLLNDIADLGERVQREPLLQGDHWPARSALGQRLDEVRPAHTAMRFLNNFAPALLVAIDKVLVARAARDRANEERWLRAVVLHVDDVRADARAAIDWLAEISKGSGND